MGQPAAKQNDLIVATDTHIILVPSASGTTPTPMTLPFNGPITEGLSANVKIDGLPAAVVGSTGKTNHIPPPGTSFQTPPSMEGRITTGSATVFINGKQAARAGDKAMTCNDPPAIPPPPGAGAVRVTRSTVFIG